ncbi:MAG: FGGY family carbohydrate kinase, partial [Planctomycetota bacterium]
MPRVLGLDFGTLSCRVLCLDLDRPGELLEGVAPFRHGVLSSSLPGGRELPGGDWALQDSGDYLEAAELALERCLPRGDARREQVIGIGVDCTASSPLPARASGEPLSCELPGEPHAYVKLWKHHRAEPWVARVREAPEAETWLKNYGGQLSCEWLLPKALELAGEAPEIWQRTERFVEAGDWIVQQLTGNWTRNLCAAGFKGMWAGEWPEPAALARLDPKLEGFVSEKLQGELLPPGVKAGELTVEMAERLGLPSGIAVSAATIDAHSGLLGMGIRGPGTLGMIMGTSACQLWLSPEERHIPGVMGVVRDGILPGCYAYEAGQAAVG